MASQAMASYLALCGNELVNAARLKAYVDNGIVPKGFTIYCGGCDGLEDILPCDFSDAPVGGYELPELDDAPWYDPEVPESKNFAGLLVTSVTMSSPYSRTVTPNVGNGQTLGRLKLKGRDILVRGFLIGKTCCATQYGLTWLTSALSGSGCAGGDCDGCDLDFLSCCPNLSDEDECITTTDANGKRVTYIRAAGQTEFQRGEDFWRRMHGVGVVSGPDVLSCKGTSCGCSCGALVEVEFVLSTSSAYVNSLEKSIFGPLRHNPDDCDGNDCDIVWNVSNDPCPEDAACAEAPDCLEDPNCPLPALPPSPVITLAGCGKGCVAVNQSRVCTTYAPERVWGTSTLNFEVYAGDKEMRNLKIQIWQNPLLLNCGDRERFPDCEACSTLIITYIPAGGTLHFSGEERSVTVTCGQKTRNAMQNVTSVDGTPFDWPDIDCVPICACVTFDCVGTSDNSSVEIFQVQRDL